MKKGFTLVELLTVIIILSLLTLLTINVVTSIVKRGKSEMNYTQEVLIEKAAELWFSDNAESLPDEGLCVYVTLQQLNDDGYIDDKLYDINKLEELDFAEGKVKVTANSTSRGTMNYTYKYNPDSVTGCIAVNDNPTYSGAYIAAGEGDTYKGIVYLDPTDLTRSCNAALTAQNVNEFGSFTGVVSGCMKFYIYGASGDNYKLLLDHNTSGAIAWNSNEAINRLNLDTKNWLGNPRLITANEIAEITGTNQNEKLIWDQSKPFGTTKRTQSSWYYFDGSGENYTGWQTQTATSANKSNYAWLYDNTYDCSQYGCRTEDPYKFSYPSETSATKNYVYGYWTSDGVVGDNNKAWRVDRTGRISVDDISYDYYFGVRPVITLPKSLVNSVIHALKTPSTLDNCRSNIAYTGTEQVLTVPIESVVYSHNKGTAVGEYEVTAEIKNGSNLVWDDSTYMPKTFSCFITKGILEPIVTCAASKTYDGNTNATCMIALDTPVEGEVVTASGSCTYENANVGTNKRVTCSNITLSGTHAANYDLSKTTVETTANITKQQVVQPTNVQVSTAGIVTWGASSNATGYEISIDGTNYTSATSGINYLSTIIASAGTRTVYVRAINSDTTNYTSPSAAASKAVNVYTVSFAANPNTYGSISPASYKVISGTTYTTNSNKLTLQSGNTTVATITASGVSSTGYSTTFSSWSPASGTITSNTTITANYGWTDSSYSLAINPNGGSWGGSTSTTNKTLNYTAVLDIPNPTRTGYTFAGWNELSGAKYTNGLSSVSVYNNQGNGVVTITSKSKSSDNPLSLMTNEYQITNSGTAAASPGLGGFYHSETCAANKVFVHLFVAKLPAGYYFHTASNALGTGGKREWLTSNAGTGAWKTYAYKVTCGSSGTFSTFGHVFVSQAVDEGTAAKTGAYTAYLAYSNVYNITSNNAGFGQLDGTATLTANWTPNNYYLDLNGWLDGASSGNISNYGTCDVYVNGTKVAEDAVDYYSQHPYGSTYTINDCKAANGRTYNGAYSGGSPLTGTIGAGTVGVYVNFTSNTYYVTYDLNGGSNGPSPNPQSFVYNSGAKLSTTVPTRTGHDFAHWKYSNGSNTFAAGAAIPTGWGSFTAVAQWTIHTNTLTVNPNGGSVTFNGAARTSATSVTQNYGTTIAVPNASGKANTSRQISSYTVTYNANSGSVSPTSATATKTGTYSYAFSSWSNSGTCGSMSGTTYTFPENKGTTCTKTASWTESLASTSGGSVTLPTPTRSGYTFNGWYTAASGGTRVGGAGASYTPTGNITLFAQWSASAITLTHSTSAVTGGGYNLVGTSVTFSCSGSTGNLPKTMVVGGTTYTNSNNANPYTVTYTFSEPGSNKSVSATCTGQLGNSASDSASFNIYRQFHIVINTNGANSVGWTDKYWYDLTNKITVTMPSLSRKSITGENGGAARGFARSNVNGSAPYDPSTNYTFCYGSGDYDSNCQLKGLNGNVAGRTLWAITYSRLNNPTKQSGGATGTNITSDVGYIYVYNTAISNSTSVTLTNRCRSRSDGKTTFAYHAGGGTYNGGTICSSSQSSCSKTVTDQIFHSQFSFGCMSGTDASTFVSF